MEAMQRPLKLFDLDGDQGAAVARLLGHHLAVHEERSFEDGEAKLRPLESVREADVYVLASLAGEAALSGNDRLCRLLFFLGALRDAGAGRLTAVVPYLCYGRKDRKTKSRDPVTTRYVAQLFEAMDLDRIVTLDVHNLAAYQNAFRLRTEHMEARMLFVEHLLPLLAGRRAVVVSPDAGGVKRAERFRQALSARLGEEAPLAFIEKHRSGGKVSGAATVGEVEGRVALLLDDMISGGTTLLKATAACRAQGAVAVHGLATHGLFRAGAERLFGPEGPDHLAVTDSLQRPLALGREAGERLSVLPIAPLLAEAIGRLHSGGSLVELMGD